MERTLKQQLTDRFVELVEQMNQQMHCRPPDEWSDLELTISQIRTLALLQQEPQRMGSISTYLGSTLSSATSIIDRLVDRGLVERGQDPDDRRVVVCRLTDSGQEAIEQFWRIGRLRIIELAEQLDRGQLETVVQAMEILNDASQQLGRLSRERPFSGESAVKGREIAPTYVTSSGGHQPPFSGKFDSGCTW